MRKLLALAVPLMLAAGTAAALGDGPDILARFARFRVSALEIRGARYVDAEEIRRLVPVYEDERGGALALEGRLRTDVLVDEAVVRSLPGDTIEIVIRERQPVALVATPALDPVDPKGEHLPIDPVVHKLDLPILRPMVGQTQTGATPTISEHLRIRTMAGEVHRLGTLHPDFARSLSEVAWTAQGTLTARFSETEAALLFQPPLNVNRLREGLAALADALPRAPERALTVADLRFQDQVVVRHVSLGEPRFGSR